MMKLNPWVKRKWVRALRSGEYRQGRGAMFTGDGGNCCLGVLAAEMVPEFCRTSGKRGLAARHFNDTPGTALELVGNAVIPNDLAVLWNLDEEAQNDLANMNDDGVSFKRIATWIEKNL